MKKLKNVILMLLLIIGTVELSPYMLAPFVLDSKFTRSDLKQELFESEDEIPELKDQEKTNENSDEYLGQHILHPYIGFVGQPRISYNKFGFPGPNPISHGSNDTLTICILGGSVAMGLWGHSQETLKRALERARYMSTKKIKIVLLALAGFKQPQQLMALNYFIAQGSKFDIIINLDGFNEIVLPYTDNLPFKVHPTFPRHWNIYSRKKINREVQMQLAKQINVQEESSERKQLIANSILNKSNFALLLWKVLDNKDKSRLYEIEEKLRVALAESGSDVQATGPSYELTDTLNFFENSAATWRRCSELMSGIAEINGARYFHFLQPNQYVIGSKTFTDFEKENALVKGVFNYKTAVRKGYSILKEEGQTLRQLGVNFVDITLLYQSETRTVYDDKCCHFNTLGYDLMAEEIAKHLIKDYSSDHKN